MRADHDDFAGFFLARDLADKVEPSTSLSLAFTFRSMASVTA